MEEIDCTMGSQGVGSHEGAGAGEIEADQILLNDVLEIRDIYVEYGTLAARGFIKQHASDTASSFVRVCE